MRAFACILLTLFAIESNAQFDLYSDLDTNTIRIGEQCILDLRISGVDEPDLIEWPRPEGSLSDQLELVYLHGPDTISTTEGTQYQMLLYITAWDSGYWALPPIQVGYKGHYEQTDPQLISVKSLPLRSDHSIEDIRPVRGVNLNWQDWLSAYWERLAYGGLALGTLAILLLLLNRHKTAVAQANKRKYMAADLKAIRALKELRSESAYSAWEKKDFYVTLSEIVRRFLEERFNLPALELTSSETVKAIRALNLEDPWTAQIASMLERADMVKFAKAAANDEIALSHFEESFGFVDNHRTELSQEDE